MYGCFQSFNSRKYNFKEQSSSNYVIKMRQSYKKRKLFYCKLCLFVIKKLQNAKLFYTLQVKRLYLQTLLTGLTGLLNVKINFLFVSKKYIFPFRYCKKIEQKLWQKRIYIDIVLFN